ncbi:uncharacterized protein [Littorina saxatilis]|uniref:uncharacterized protein n=1 Tax=Littorina saxatilis TaxID=31220 RepID=UPI0038B4F915
MIKAMLWHSLPQCIMTARKAMREQGKVLKWKKYPEDIKEIFALMCEVTFPKWLTEKQMEKGMTEFENLSSYFLDEAKKAGIAKLELTGPMLEFVFHCLEMHTPQAYSLAETVASRLEFNQKKDKEAMMEVFRRVTTLVEDDSHDWEDMETRDLGNTVRELIDKAVSCVKDGKAFTFEEYDELIYLAKISLTKMNTLTEPTTSALFTVYTVVSMRVANWLTTMNEGHRLIPLIPGMIELMESEEELMRQIGSGAMAMVSQSAGSLFSQYLGRLIECFLETEQDMVLMAVSNSYEHNPAPMEKHFDALFEYIDSGNAGARSHVLQILQKVAKRQPHLFTEEKVEAVMKEAKEDQMHQVLILMILADLAKRRLDRVEPFIDDFMNPDLWQPNSAHSVVSILQVYGLDAEEKADQVIKHLLGRVKASEDHNEVFFSLNAIRLIGFKHRPAIEKHRRSIEEFKDSTSDNDLHASVTYILDMLDGKSLDKIADELREVQGDLAELDVRVTTTEKDLSGVKDTVQRHGDDLDNVKNDMSEQGQRLGQVEGTVDETVAKVQEIDGKTLSHAPYWARDVSRLLNVETDNDWRLLSLRLGYSNDDIRAWAQQADPCMAMLNEWYTTHKTREATHAVLTSLQLLDREDAAVIVENAMKAAEEVVDDTEFEYATPPDIFLSYQWGHQDEVRLLRQHLEMAGFSCWMDVGQMGGGDKLFEKIDTGIRGAKVVISCVTAKYAKSPNCNREVNLAVNLGKPIFPLLMEKTTWPPPGSMGPIFSEYLFIRFFQRAGEETPDQRYWPLPKFQELLMQLSINGVKPDQQAIQPEYKDWWVPKVEAVTVDKDRAKKQTSASSAPAVDDKKAAESPDVFISYQWGKQPQILKLYQRLTSLGYTCWLDIMQMGGGDSLYDKIDRGVRGCRVVLACVTTKYAKSANCRREVSLADALQKPLVPLLLEGMAWPPPGPMSPVLTGLLYVDCTRDNMEDSWAGPKFDQLITVINQHIPAPDGGQESAGGERNDKEKGGMESKGSVVNQQVPSPQEGGGKGSDGGTGGESNDGESGGTKSKASVPPSSAQPAEKQQCVESKPQQEVQPVAVRKSQVAPASRAPEDGTDGDTNNSSKLSAQKEEQKPAVHGTSARKQSNASSVQSDLGHDAYNPSNLRSAGFDDAVQTKSSACCAIL